MDLEDIAANLDPLFKTVSVPDQFKKLMILLENGKRGVRQRQSDGLGVLKKLSKNQRTQIITVLKSFPNIIKNRFPKAAEVVQKVINAADVSVPSISDPFSPMDGAYRRADFYTDNQAVPRGLINLRRQDYDLKDITKAVNPTNLMVYPQWGSKVQRQIDATQKKEALQRDLATKGIKDKANPYFRFLEGQGAAKFEDGRWQGQLADKLATKPDKMMESLSKRLDLSERILQTKITDEQVTKEVPTAIKDLVAASNALSTSGFGPIKRGGLALYAGRWVDPVTGRVRLLPTASKDYINPVSFNQNIAYLQARLLNNWNKLVNDIQRYNSIASKGPGAFQGRARAKIAKKCDIQTIALSEYKAFYSYASSFLKGLILTGTPRYYLMYTYLALNGNQFSKLFPYTPQAFTQLDVKQQEALLGDLQSGIYRAGKRFLQNVQLKTPQGVRMANSIMALVNQYYNYQSKRVINAGKTLIRASMITDNAKPQVMQKQVEDLSSVYRHLKENAYKKVQSEAALYDKLAIANQSPDKIGTKYLPLSANSFTFNQDPLFVPWGATKRAPAKVYKPYKGDQTDIPAPLFTSNIPSALLLSAQQKKAIKSYRDSLGKLQSVIQRLGAEYADTPLTVEAVTKAVQDYVKKSQVTKQQALAARQRLDTVAKNIGNAPDQYQQENTASASIYNSLNNNSSSLSPIIQEEQERLLQMSQMSPPQANNYVVQQKQQPLRLLREEEGLLSRKTPYISQRQKSEQQARQVEKYIKAQRQSAQYAQSLQLYEQQLARLQQIEPQLQQLNANKGRSSKRIQQSKGAKVQKRGGIQKKPKVQQKPPLKSKQKSGKSLQKASKQTDLDKYKKLGLEFLKTKYNSVNSLIQIAKRAQAYKLPKRQLQRTYLNKFLTLLLSMDRKQYMADVIRTITGKEQLSGSLVQIEKDILPQYAQAFAAVSPYVIHPYLTIAPQTQSIFIQRARERFEGQVLKRATQIIPQIASMHSFPTQDQSSKPNRPKKRYGIF